MSQDKYYTPSIEEFRVGFEYEYNSETLQYNLVDFSDPMTIPEKIGNEVKVWNKRIFGVTDFETMIYNIGYSDRIKRYRVKYLDREDIESCGFEIIKEGCPWQYMKGGCKLVTDIHSDKTGMPENTKVIIYQKGDEYPYFDGTIKNISELKQILTMIGVDYEKNDI